MLFVFLFSFLSAYAQVAWGIVLSANMEFAQWKYISFVLGVCLFVLLIERKFSTFSTVAPTDSGNCSEDQSEHSQTSQQSRRPTAVPPLTPRDNQLSPSSSNSQQPLHHRLKANAIITPTPDCHLDTQVSNREISRCDVAMLQVCHDSVSGREKFCELNETTPLPVEDVLFVTEYVQPWQWFVSAAIARGEHGRTMLIARSHKHANYQHYVGHEQGHAMKTTRPLYERLLATREEEVTNLDNEALFWAFDRFGVYPTHAMEELMYAFSGYSQMNSSATWLYPAVRDNYVPLMSQALPFFGIDVKRFELGKVYRAKKIYFPQFFMGDRYDPTGIRFNVVDRFLTLWQRSENPMILDRVFWLPSPNEAVVADFDLAAIALIKQKPKFKRLMKLLDYTDLAPMGLLEKMWYLNNAKKLVLDYDTTLMMFTQMRQRCTVYNQEILVLTPGAPCNNLFVAKSPLCYDGSIRDGRERFNKHVLMDEYANRWTPLPWCNATFKYYVTSELDYLEEEDLMRWTILSHNELEAWHRKRVPSFFPPPPTPAPTENPPPPTPAPTENPTPVPTEKP
jgi:hypothetical protein